GDPAHRRDRQFRLACHGSPIPVGRAAVVLRSQGRSHTARVELFCSYRRVSRQDSARRNIVGLMQLYRRPDEYDLELTGDDADLKFYVELATRLKPKSVLELACGTGRITLPMAEEGARSGFSVVGLD